MNNKISIVIPHVPLNPELDDMLDRCIKSLYGQYDELVLVINDGIGYGAAFNRGFTYATGNYIVAVSNDTVLTEGKLRDMCAFNTVTFSANAQFGCFFAGPAHVFKYTVGGFDESFGLAYFEDNDMLTRLKDAGIPVKRVASVKVDHVGGATVKALGKEAEASAFAKNRWQEKWGDRDPNEALP